MYRAVSTIDELREYRPSATFVAFDFETTPDEKHRKDDRSALDAHISHIVGISLSVTEAFAERVAMNTPIQGTAVDILKLALGRILPGLPERPWLRPLLQIHDEVVFELPENEVKNSALFIKNCMEAQPFEAFSIPIVAESSVGHRFGEMKELEVSDE